MGWRAKRQTGRMVTGTRSAGKRDRQARGLSECLEHNDAGCRDANRRVKGLHDSAVLRPGLGKSPRRSPMALRFRPRVPTVSLLKTGLSLFVCDSRTDPLFGGHGPMARNPPLGERNLLGILAKYVDRNPDTLIAGERRTRAAECAQAEAGQGGGVATRRWTPSRTPAAGGLSLIGRISGRHSS